MIYSLGPLQGETEAAYQVRMETFIKESEADTASRIADLKLIVAATQTALREKKPLIGYLPEGHWLRNETPDSIRLKLKTNQKALKAWKPIGFDLMKSFE